MKQWSLTLHSPNGILSTFDSGETQFVIGTEEAANVFTVSGDDVAARHAWLWLAAERIQVEDLCGGTLVNGHPITERVEVEYPASVQMGSLTLVVEEKVASANRSSAVTIVQPQATLLDLLPSMILPALTLIIVMVAYILRMVRSSVIDVTQSEYVQMAYLKGVPHRRVVWQHIIPNVLIPTINAIALTVAWLVGGVVVVETVFNFPGIGRLLTSAVNDRDLPLVQALGLVGAFFYIGTNTFADVVTLWLTPRLRTQYWQNAHEN
jgi:ABC-type dipeptide/oligopeptide/nickel transport system permease component